MSTKLKSVIYTDGSARPNPGPESGWGMYGYTYTHTTPCVNVNLDGVDPSKEITVLKDGKYHNPVKLSEWNAWGGLSGIRDNNEGEIQGIIEAVRVSLDNGVQELEIRSDSKTALKGADQWVDQWAKNNWQKSDGTPPSYIDSWTTLKSMKDEAKKKNMSIKYTWVKGHMGNVGNELADISARKGGILAGAGHYEPVTETITVADSEGKVKKAPIPKAPPVCKLLMQTRWYFTTNTERIFSKDGRRVYHLGNHKENELFGKRVSDAANTIIFVKKEDPVMEAILEKQNEFSTPYQVPFYARLDKIKASTRYRQLYHDKCQYLTAATPDGPLLDVAGEILTEPALPTMLAFIGLEELTSLQQRLEDYVACSKGPSKLEGRHVLSRAEKKRIVSITNITDHFYEVEGNGKPKLSKSILDGAKFLNIDIAWHNSVDTGTHKAIFTLGLDAPPKNTLSGISGKDTVLYAISWPESDRVMRYALVVEVDGNTALLASTYSNCFMI